MSGSLLELLNRGLVAELRHEAPYAKRNGYHVTADRMTRAADEIERLTRALELVDEPYPRDVFPDLQMRDEVFAAMRKVNRYATEQFFAEISRQRARVAREFVESDRREGAR